MSLPVSEKSLVYVGNPRVKVNYLKTIEEHGRNVECITLSTHTGTHMDAPFHFIKNGMKINEIPSNLLMGQGFLIRTTKKPGGEITIEDIARYQDRVDPKAFVILDTGFEKYYGDEETYLTRFPHLSVDVANTLVKKRIQAVGVDVPSVDKYGSTHFPVHHILLENKILIIEGLSNLKKLKENSDITIITLPLKLCGVGGAPARVIAIQR